MLAAYRAGLREVIVPQGNAKDLRDIPAEVRERMTFTFVQTMDEVLHRAMLPLDAPPAEGETEADPQTVPAEMALPSESAPPAQTPAVLPFPDRSQAAAHRS